ncbi:MAG: SGNH/GDSL hydrolase family protein [Muribaculaceae bacterium]|nr:SGNH/GDSL hydrolase family protein [Muribaculaceae bacterium]
MLLLFAGKLSAQDFTNADTLRFVDAMQFRMINYAFDKTLETRIPRALKDSVRPTLWERAQCTSGKAFRFATDSRAVAVRYNLLTNMHMMHMADTGIKGTDLYILDDNGTWQFVNCNRPVRIDSDVRPREDSIQRKVMVDKLDGRMHEYMLYLPLYDGVRWLEIGIDSTATIMEPVAENPQRSPRFVFYGTSILQGGCACRPGMVATSILQRTLGVECINLGFSGEGKMDSCMARAMATIPDVAAFILDPVPNCTKNMCDSLTYGFVHLLRTLRPEVPIIMVEGPMYSYAKYSSFYGEYLPQKNEKFHDNFLRLLADNPNNIYYVGSNDLWGPDNEGTVDGIHLTDIGFYFYAKKLEPYLRNILEGNNAGPADTYQTQLALAIAEKERERAHEQNDAEEKDGSETPSSADEQVAPQPPAAPSKADKQK